MGKLYYSIAATDFTDSFKFFSFGRMCTLERNYVKSKFLFKPISVGLHLISYCGATLHHPRTQRPCICLEILWQWRGIFIIEVCTLCKPTIS